MTKIRRMESFIFYAVWRSYEIPSVRLSVWLECFLGCHLTWKVTEQDFLMKKNIFLEILGQKGPKRAQNNAFQVLSKIFM